MAINIRMQTQTNRLKPKITVIGVGGAGGNAVNNMINSNLEGCEFLVCNTDAQALEGSSAPHKIQLGVNVTRGLGAGANPEIGGAAAEESIDEILAYLEGSNMVFVTAGLGGGTGTGAAPVIAQAAREAGILTVGVVTKPFHFEGTHRMKLAENGINELQKHVDTLIIIPNQNLFRIANEKTTFSDAFCMADEVLQSGVRGVTDLMVMPGLINLDFADIRAVMAEMGKAMMGTGEAEGERRAVEAAEKAISNPLLDDVSMKGARGVLINITGGLDMTLFEVDEAANRIRDEVDPDANIIFGSTFDQTMNGTMRVSVVATGIEAAAMQNRPVTTISTGHVEPSRRPAQQAVPQRTQSAGGYASFERTREPQAQSQSSGGGYTTGAMPASIMPTQAAHRPQVTAQATARPVTATAPKPAMAGADAGAGDGWQRSPEPQQTGHAASTGYAGAQTATARKLNEDMDETQTWTKPVQPPVTQNYPQRQTTAQTAAPAATAPAAPSGPARGQRHGNSFIPPKPVDPRHAGGTSADLFTSDDLAAPAKPQPAAEKPVKKAPPLFERFTLQRKEDVTAPAATAPAAPALSVEEGGKQAAEDELDIPAFLRRQAN
ncbi:MAG: cell division protein FtsZ [Alphaproteobacteria bacterium]|nr:cell division protein FtsZ [Alphaproteobacteria bacterium]